MWERYTEESITMASDYPHLEEFSFEKYAKKEQEAQEEGLSTEITQASDQQEERGSTPDVDWETRYKDLEQHNSRQAQELGSLRTDNAQYKTAFDDFLLNDSPTPAESQPDPTPITNDDLFDRPDEVINRAIENHPAIREAQETAEQQRRQAILQAKASFEGKHPSYQETMSNPDFSTWVKESGTRVGLAQRADKWDFEAADALFSQALQGMTQQTQQAAALEQATLESAGVGDAPPDKKFSRHEMREVMISAKQGDPKAERYYNSVLPAYRAALAAGEVTD